MSYCSYYQAVVSKKDTWFMVAVLRSFEHVAFDRTFDAAAGIFEFFVPAQLEDVFCQLMDYFVSIDVVSNVQKLPNRLKDPAAEV